MMKRFEYWVCILLLSSFLLTSPLNGDDFIGARINDTFQLTFEFPVEFKGSYTIPHTIFSVDEVTQPIIVDYRIKDITESPFFLHDIVLSLKSEWILQNNYEIEPPIRLRNAYEISNGSYFQPPPVLSLDFKAQYSNLLNLVINA